VKKDLKYIYFLLFLNIIENIKSINNIVYYLKMVKSTKVLNKYYEDNDAVEIGVDEVGRGPLFGRVYAAAVILPKDDSFNHSKMKDSKKFHSAKKIQEASDYIKENAIAWAIQYEDEKTIDTINILQASQSAMHKSIAEVFKQTQLKPKSTKLLIDGNYFKPFRVGNNPRSAKSEILIKNWSKSFEKMEDASAEEEYIDYVCIEGGDNKYSAIAAASILAKVERDRYIEDLCTKYPDLIEKYGIDSNKGYGSKTHIAGIKEYGITMWHRQSFGICKNYKI